MSEADRRYRLEIEPGAGWPLVEDPNGDIVILSGASQPAPADPDVPNERRVRTVPDSPLAWALLMVGAFTVKDDSDAICTMALGDLNSVARRMQTWLDKQPAPAGVPPEGIDVFAGRADRGPSVSAGVRDEDATLSDTLSAPEA